MYSLNHILHCISLFVVLFLTELSLHCFMQNKIGTNRIRQGFSTISECLISTMLLLLVIIPMTVRLYLQSIVFCGLILFECFPKPVKLKADLTKLPKICIRAVTKGDYPNLVKDYAVKNKLACQAVGLKKFIIEVVTEKRIPDFPNDNLIKQVVVPENYETSRGTLFKARNLQYCLEPGVNILQDEDWIVHMDEDSLLTEDAVKGIANFIKNGQYCVGQGRISYDQKNQSSTIVRLFMACTLICDYGSLPFFVKFLPSHVVIKGSFVACNVKIEKEVSFDGGPTCSVSEDIYFTYMLRDKGLKIGIIEGNIEEIGTLTLKEVINQVSRIIGGIMLLATNQDVKRFKHYNLKLMIILTILSTPLSVFSLFINFFLQFDYVSPFLLYTNGIILATDIYTGFFAIFKHPKLSVVEFWKLFIVNLALRFFLNLVFGLSFIKYLIQGKLEFKVSKKRL